LACLHASDKSGGVGIWQISAGAGTDEISSVLDRLARSGTQAIGVALDDLTALALLKSAPAGLIDHIIAPVAVLHGAGNKLRALPKGATLWAEVTRWSDDLAKLPKQVGGFILKGHECAGVVSEQTTFLLLQEFRRKTSLALIARGGITPATAAAAAVAGAAGVMLDDQIMLLPEAGLKNTAIRQRITGLSGSETVQVEDLRGGAYLRGFALHPREVEPELITAMQADPDATLAKANALSWAKGKLMPGGQGLALAAGVLRRHATLGRFINALRKAWDTLPAEAAQRGILRENSPLAKANGTRFPIFQGPMTRVSDVSDFFVRVADGGGLPFAALALLRGEQAETLLSQTEAQMGDKPWGVGLLGFAGSKVLTPQFAAIEKHKPDFAIVAGARIDQLQNLEGQGIRAFAHVASASLLTHYMDEGITRFVIEGRECGGHIGPMSSFVLWSAILDALDQHRVTQKSPRKIQLIFAGGIHDNVSAAMVATLAEPFAARGVQIGVLMGTAYLFTPEIVASGAIVPDYQEVALSTDSTQALWEGPGFASRCAVTPITHEFRTKRAELQAQGATITEIKDALEHYTLGRLRMATKGLARTGPDGKLTEIGLEQRQAEGMYMIGQVAALQDKVQTIADLHDNVANGSARHLQAFAPYAHIPAQAAAPKPTDIAIIGMATLLPGSDTLEGYWRRITSGESAIREIPSDRWSLTGYFSEDPKERDKIYSMRGGFLPDIAFDPLNYGIPPSTIPSVDPMQLLTLEVVSDALNDAAMGGDHTIDRERMSVVFGFSGGLGEVGAQYATRSELTRLMGKVPEEMLARLPEWTEDSFAGLLPNVAAGRVANRFDLGGTNQIVDAACASSLAALYSAVLELETGRADAVIAGGVDTLQSPFGYLCFAKTTALSPRGVCNTFDQAADGIVISEGLAAVVLKRLDDAERDGDRIYAVIKGVGASSDGRAKGLTAPLPKGQRRALRRAYAQAGFEPSSVQLFEAHGTGTVAGDKAELETVSGILADSDVPNRSVAIGSVKTLIGHTKASAGIAGLIKVALGLHHRTLPPHALVKAPNAVFQTEDTPLFLSQSPRPWVVPEDQPRRAGVSAFGFGGTNFHVALQEYADAAQPAPLADAGADVVPFAFAADNREGLAKSLARLAAEMAKAPSAPLADLAQAVFSASGAQRLAFVAQTREQLHELTEQANSFVTGDAVQPPEGVYYTGSPALLNGGKLAFLFSGQGAQYPDMHRQTALIAPPLLQSLCRAETLLAETPTFRKLGRPLARLIYPGDAFLPEDRKAQLAALTATEVAQPALGAIETGLANMLADLGVTPDLAAGHSYGEFAALCAAGAISYDDLIRLSEARGRAMVDNVDPENPGAMIAVKADEAATRKAVGELKDVMIANLNSPVQTVIAGSEAAIERAAEALKSADLHAVRVRVSQAFHSPLMKPAQKQFAKAIAEATWAEPCIPVYSNVTTEPHDPAKIAKSMAEHLISPVDFVTQVRHMARDGAKVFVEVGPKSILADRVGEIMSDPDITAIALDAGKGDALAFMAGLAQLFVQGAPVDLPALLAGFARPLARDTGPETANTWYLNGAYARRAADPRRNVEPPADGFLGRGHVSAAVPAHDDYDEELEFMEMKPDMVFPPGGATATGQGEMMTSYHAMMTEFLRVQESVMRAYLQNGGAALPATSMPQMQMPAPVAQPIPQPVAQPMAAPVPQPVAAPVAASVAVVEAPAPAPAPEATPAAAMTRDGTLAAFVQIVAEKTGYPADALDPDQALEADLGVDSIKRMEILSTMQKSLPDELAQAMRADMDAISQLATMREIVDYVFDNAGVAATTGAAPEATDPFDQAGEAETTARAVLPRYVQVPFAEDASHVPEDLEQGTIAVVTESPDGFHNTLMAALAEKGITAKVLPSDVLGDSAALINWFDMLELDGIPLALIHCASRATLPDTALASPEAWHAAHESGTKTVFRLLQAAQPHLQTGGRFVSVMQTGGYFGRSTQGADAPMTAQPGVLGLVKALSLEWPDCSLKAVDLDPALDHASQTAHVLRELTMRSGRREAGYPAGQRTIFRTEPAATEPPIEPVAEPNKDWVILASGGARGITAECLRTLAPSGATLVLLGRSPQPAPEPEDMRALDLAGLRAHFLGLARDAGEKIKPAEIEARVNRHLGLRDMDTNLRDFATMGATVDYRAVDVCDADAVQSLCADLMAQYGRIDMLVHGAGLIEDMQFEKKTVDSFNRVFDTKVDSALTLVNAARNPHLKGVCFFTSVAGRYGNPGQSDYAAANETLNFYARHLTNQMPDIRIAAINWGPWDATTTGAGMVTDSTRAQFLSRGIGMVEPVPGREYFWREMFWADPAQVETSGWVADGETMEAAICDLPPNPEAPAKPSGLLLLNGAERGADQLSWRFDMVSAPFTDDHRFDRHAVMPMAGMMQIFSEIPAAFGIEHPVVELQNLRMLQGLTLKDGPLNVRLEMQPTDTPDLMQARVLSCGEKPRVLYQADLVLADALPQSTAGPTGSDGIAPWAGPSLDHMYRRWLSHGPRFHVLDQMAALDTTRIRAQANATAPQEFVPHGIGHSWNFDPGLIDGMLQLLWIWTRTVHDISGLPLGAASVKRFAPATGLIWLEIDQLSLSDTNELTANASAFDTSGRLCYQAKGFRIQCARALNRLGGGWPLGDRSAAKDIRKVAE
jgi:acyl transferase domain-containing protein/NAD(P)-dependent dehydrogenase (short-subunit alcohol dehydrogenase family)